MLSSAVLAFGLVFLAELGDRTQLIVLTAGARGHHLRLFAVLVGVIAALQGVAVLAGEAVGGLLPDRATAALTAALFAGFAVWVWRDAEGDEQVGTGAPPSLWKLALAFAVAEVGDKSMLAGAALAANEHAVGVWLGATVGESAVTAVGLWAGRWLARRVDPARLARLGALAFAAAAAVSVLAAITGWGIG